MRVGASAIQALASRLVYLAEAMLDGSVPPGWTASRMESEIVDALVGALAHTAESKSSPVTGRRKLTRDAIAWARERDFNVSMSAPCETTTRSRRALELAFRQVVDMSPARYFRQARLEGAYRDLARARSQETTVTQVAMRWGFSELGRFAGALRTWFGELPSDTLARAPVRHRGIPAVGATGKSRLRDVHA